MHHPNDDPNLFAFPELPDEAVIAINDFIEAFYTNFQNHYFAQMHRYEHDGADPAPSPHQTVLALGDPPF
jgi:hypothetical protein